MMAVLALGTQNRGSDTHITTPCSAFSKWNPADAPLCQEISLAGNTLVVTRRHRSGNAVGSNPDSFVADRRH